MSLTSKPGSPDPSVEQETLSSINEEQNRSVPLRLIVLGAIALILAVVIGTQVLGVLYILVFPPAPPLPADVTLVSHINTDHGFDEWLYTSSQSACDVVTFYVDNGAVCRIAPTCDDVNTDPEQTLPNVENASQSVARCVGQSQMSIFSMHWQVIVAASPDPNIASEFRLIREVIWTGGAALPESSPEP